MEHHKRMMMVLIILDMILQPSKVTIGLIGQEPVLILLMVLLEQAISIHLVTPHLSPHLPPMIQLKFLLIAISQIMFSLVQELLRTPILLKDIISQQRITLVFILLIQQNILLFVTAMLTQMSMLFFLVV